MTTPQTATRVVLRPLATPLPLGFLALALATTVFATVQLGWIPPTEGRVAALTALVATVPLQLTAAVIGFLARDPVAATGMGILSGTWAVVGLTTVTSPPGTASKGLGVLLIVAGISMFVPASAGATKLVPAAVMALAGIRFLVTGAYELTGSASWKTTAGWVGLALAVLALYAAVALELEGTRGRTVLPAGRPARSGRGRGPRRGVARARRAGSRAGDPTAALRGRAVEQSRNRALRPRPGPSPPAPAGLRSDSVRREAWSAVVSPTVRSPHWSPSRRPFLRCARRG